MSAETAGRLSVSVVVPTFRRPAPLRTLLDTLSEQTRRPEELIVIDAAPDAVVEESLRKQQGRYDRVMYIPFPSSLTQSRNLGIKESHGRIVVFLDDDLELAPRFIEELVAPIEADGEFVLGGVTGDVSNLPRRLGSLSNWMRWMLQLPCEGNGRFRLSGAPTVTHGAREDLDVEFLPGGLTAWRREVFDELLFDEALPGVGPYEDVDFSYRSSRTWRHVYTPKARVVHARPDSSVTREAALTHLGEELRAYWYVFRKNQPKTPLRLLAFLTHQCGVVFRFFIRRLRRRQNGRNRP